MLAAFFARFSKILVMPFVVAIGALGYYIEQKVASPKHIPYLDASVEEEREARQMKVELDPDYGAPTDMNTVKSKIVPKSSLSLNKGRQGLIDNEIDR